MKQTRLSIKNLEFGSDAYKRVIANWILAMLAGWKLLEGEYTIYRRKPLNGYLHGTWFKSPEGKSTPFHQMPDFLSEPEIVDALLMLDIDEKQSKVITAQWNLSQAESELKSAENALQAAVVRGVEIRELCAPLLLRN